MPPAVPDPADRDPVDVDPVAVPPGRPALGDDVLVARAAVGDPRAFEQLVRRHQKQMFHVALRITGNVSDAEDAAQNAFLAAWNRLPEFRHEARFSTWLYRIVSNHALNQVRARRRTDQQRDLAELVGDDQPSAPDPGPSERAEAGALLDDVRAAVAALPEELRTCWYAREVDGYSYLEVAAIAGVSFDVARGRIYRARQRLAEDLRSWR